MKYKGKDHKAYPYKMKNKVRRFYPVFHVQLKLFPFCSFRFDDNPIFIHRNRSVEFIFTFNLVNEENEENRTRKN